MTALQAAELNLQTDHPIGLAEQALTSAPARPALNLEALARVATHIYEGDQFFTGLLVETGVILVRGNLIVDGHLDVRGQLLVEGNLTVHGALDCAATESPGVIATGDISIIGKGRVYRDAYSRNEAAVAIASTQGDITLDGNMEVDGLLYAPAASLNRGIITLHGLVTVRGGAMGRAVEPCGLVRFQTAGGTLTVPPQPEEQGAEE